ncbi:MAG: hypothetical protein A3J83_04645 [Elusimicrobia bacterium RIFOXYA2_FULL_40_6]|nr:MAG: hypothetical protein A3J83_04645 [Elusimicrobia bacterium RIFOXYA2_FULL_40_6]
MKKIFLAFFLVFVVSSGLYAWFVGFGTAQSVQKTVDEAVKQGKISATGEAPSAGIKRHGITLQILDPLELTGEYNPNPGKGTWITPCTLRAAGGNPLTHFTWASATGESGPPLGVSINPITGIWRATNIDNYADIPVGVYNFKYTVSDGLDTVKGSFKLTVTQPQAEGNIPAGYTVDVQLQQGTGTNNDGVISLPDAISGEPYCASLFACGGTPPYSWFEDTTYTSASDLSNYNLMIDMSNGVVRTITGTNITLGTTGQAVRFKVKVRDSQGEYDVRSSPTVDRPYYIFNILAPTEANPENGIPQQEIPVAPEQPVVTSGYGFCTITWLTVNDANSYDLYWSTFSGLTTANGIHITDVTSPYTLTDSTNGVTYYFGVVAENSEGTSGMSAVSTGTPTSSAAPAPPTRLMFTAGDSQALVSWKNSAGATSYNLYWLDSSELNKTNGTKVTGAVSTHTLTDLDNGTTCYAGVTAVNAFGESALSSIVSGCPKGVVASSTGSISASAWFQNRRIIDGFAHIDLISTGTITGPVGSNVSITCDPPGWGDDFLAEVSILDWTDIPDMGDGKRGVADPVTTRFTASWTDIQYNSFDIGSWATVGIRLLAPLTAEELAIKEINVTIP